MYYSEKKDNKQGVKPLKYGRTHYTTCRPHSRCKQIHKCKTCHEIHAKKQLDKHLGHIKDKDLKKFKHALYITITPKELCRDFDIHNSNIDHFNRYLTDTAARRYKSHPFFKSEYIIFKEITKTKQGFILPHLHIVLFTNDYPSFESSFLSFDIRDIKIELNDKYKNDYKNPLTQTIKKLFAYSTKSDKSRFAFERTSNASKGKSDIKSSLLFKPREPKAQNILPIHIQLIRNIKQHARTARKEALKKHADYKAKHKRAKDITIHRHALKIQKELKKIEQNKRELIRRLESKLKGAARPFCRSG